MLHTREFCYAKSKSSCPSRFANKHSKESTAACHSDYRGVVEGLHRRHAVKPFQEGASTPLLLPTHHFTSRRRAAPGAVWPEP